MGPGSWADWVNAGAALLVGVALMWLTSKTNKLAEAANRTSQAMAELERKREADDSAMRVDERRQILIAIHDPIGIARATMSVPMLALGNSGQYFQNFVRDATARKAVREALELARFVIPESVRSRLHYLEPSLAGRISRIESGPAYLLTFLAFIPEGPDELAEDGTRAFLRMLRHHVDEMGIVRKASEQACIDAGLPVERTSLE